MVLHEFQTTIRRLVQQRTVYHGEELCTHIRRQYYLPKSSSIVRPLLVTGNCFVRRMNFRSSPWWHGNTEIKFVCLFIFNHFVGRFSGVGKPVAKAKRVFSKEPSRVLIDCNESSRSPHFLKEPVLTLVIWHIWLFDMTAFIFHDSDFFFYYYVFCFFSFFFSVHHTIKVIFFFMRISPYNFRTPGNHYQSLST